MTRGGEEESGQCCYYYYPYSGDDAPPGEEERGGLKMIENCTPEFFRASSRTIRINPLHSAGAPLRKKGVAILDTRKVIDPRFLLLKSLPSLTNGNSSISSCLVFCWSFCAF